MKIATWNVNSMKVRLQHVLEWLAANSPDVLVLQEIKQVSEAFPAEELREAVITHPTRGDVLYLEDIATVTGGSDQPEQYTWFATGPAADAVPGVPASGQLFCHQKGCPPGHLHQ